MVAFLLVSTRGAKTGARVLHPNILWGSWFGLLLGVIKVRKSFNPPLEG